MAQQFGTISGGAAVMNEAWSLFVLGVEACLSLVAASRTLDNDNVPAA